MADANAINYLALQDAVLGKRFPSGSQRPNAKRWLATAYSDVWNAADWTFKRVSLATLAIVSGDETPTMPADFGEAKLLVDNYGDELRRMPQEAFERQYAGDLILGTVGAPEAFTVVNGQIILAPKPSLTGNFRLSYERRVSHLLSDQSTVQAGFMVADTSYPLWADHHGVLIPRAVSIGLQELNDPTWQEPQQEYERQLSRMENDQQQMYVGYGYRAGHGHWGDN